MQQPNPALFVVDYTGGSKKWITMSNFLRFRSFLKAATLGAVAVLLRRTAFAHAQVANESNQHHPSQRKEDRT